MAFKESFVKLHLLIYPIPSRTASHCLHPYQVPKRNESNLNARTTIGLILILLNVVSVSLPLITSID